MIVNGKTYILECLGAEKTGPRFLNGVTENRNVNMSPDATDVHSGASWRAISIGGDTWQFLCLGKGEELKYYLNGKTVDAAVELNSDPALSGTFWKVTRQSSGRYQVVCQGKLEGATYLNGVTINSSVNLSKYAEDTGTFWRLYQLVD